MPAFSSTLATIEVPLRCIPIIMIGGFITLTFYHEGKFHQHAKKGLCHLLGFLAIIVSIKPKTMNQTKIRIRLAAAVAALSIFSISCKNKVHADGATNVDTVYVHDTVYQASSGFSLSNTTGCLYLQCGNVFSVDGIEDNFEVKSAQVTVLNQQGANSFTIIPKENVVTVNLKAGDVDRSVEYCAVRPPKPEIEMLVNGQIYTGMAPISKKSNVLLRIKPDADFKTHFPTDSRYVIDQVDLLVQRSLGAPVKVGSFSGSGKDATIGIPVALGNKLKADPPGTKIYLKIGKVSRVNYQNMVVEEAFSERELVLSAIIK